MNKGFGHKRSKSFVSIVLPERDPKTGAFDFATPLSPPNNHNDLAVGMDDGAAEEATRDSPLLDAHVGIKIVASSPPPPAPDSGAPDADTESDSDPYDTPQQDRGQFLMP